MKHGTVAVKCSLEVHQKVKYNVNTYIRQNEGIKDVQEEWNWAHHWIGNYG